MKSVKRSGLDSLALLLFAACLVSQAAAYVTLPPLVTTTPVTNWLLTTQTVPPYGSVSQNAAWKKIGAKFWTFLSTLDHDFVNAAGQPVPPKIATKRIFGPTVSCGRFARLWIRLPFHDCGTYDVGNTGSVNGTALPRFGCNGSLRKEIAPCTTPGPSCVNGVEARFNLTSGTFLNETAFASLEKRFGANSVDWGFDRNHPRTESTGFAMSLAFMYQVKLETERVEPPTTRLTNVSVADLIVYAGMLAVAKCGGPQIEFQPGRPDANTYDEPVRLPAPTEKLSQNIAYFWANGLTNFDMVNLLAAHSTACFQIGCQDATPNKLDPDWARQMLSVTSANDPRICQFGREHDGAPPATPVPMCFLPSDTEFNARADIRNYLRALTGDITIQTAATAADACPKCNYQTNNSKIYGDCNNQAGVWPFKPFQLVKTADGFARKEVSVNLCNRLGAVGCGASHNPQAQFNDAFATSFFKMSKMYAKGGVNQGALYGVQTQPCQPGLIQIGFIAPPVKPGEEEIGSVPNPRCLCCPNPLPQQFTFAQLARVQNAAAATPATEVADVITEAGLSATSATTAAATGDADSSNEVSATAAAAATVGDVTTGAEEVQGAPVTAAAAAASFLEPLQVQAATASLVSAAQTAESIAAAKIPPTVAITNRNAQSWAAFYAQDRL